MNDESVLELLYLHSESEILRLHTRARRCVAGWSVILIASRASQGRDKISGSNICVYIICAKWRVNGDVLWVYLKSVKRIESGYKQSQKRSTRASRVPLCWTRRSSSRRWRRWICFLHNAHLCLNTLPGTHNFWLDVMWVHRRSRLFSRSCASCRWVWSWPGTIHFE